MKKGIREKNEKMIQQYKIKVTRDTYNRNQKEGQKQLSPKLSICSYTKVYYVFLVKSKIYS